MLISILNEGNLQRHNKGNNVGFLKNYREEEMNKNKRYLTIFSLSILLTNGIMATAYAELSLGVGVLALNMPYKKYDMKVTPFPVISYKGEDFWVNGLGAGYYLFNSVEDKVSIISYYDPIQFKHEDSDDKKMRQLTTRKGTMMSGLSYVHKTQQYGSLRVALTGDVLSNSNGITVDAAWLYRYATGSLAITPALGIKLDNGNQNDYYYGISKYESRRSGMERYDPDASISPYAELSIGYDFSGNWNLYGVGRWTRLSDEITDSPMIENSWDSILSVGVTYSF